MPARSYGQFCGLARALEHVGDRWTLLIVRQLLTSPRRYVDLQRALVGISSNVLADRLQRLEADGIAHQTELPAPARTPVWDLTDEGRTLEPVVLELLRWGTRYLADPDRSDEPAHDDWMVLPLRWLAARAPVDREHVWRFEVDGERTMTVRVAGTDVELDPGAAAALVVRASRRGDLAAALAGVVPPPGQLELDGAAGPFVQLVDAGNA
ncbi:MAG: helix-turn-helix domain-containing protein [Actinomycetota bacterium]